MVEQCRKSFQKIILTESKILSINEHFIKRFNKESDGHFLDVEVHYPEQLHELHNDLPFLPERMQIKKS